jgi:hypothetical protein
VRKACTKTVAKGQNCQMASIKIPAPAQAWGEMLAGRGGFEKYLLNLNNITDVNIIHLFCSTVMLPLRKNRFFFHHNTCKKC